MISPRFFFCRDCAEIGGEIGSFEWQIGFPKLPNLEADFLFPMALSVRSNSCNNDCVPWGRRIIGLERRFTPKSSSGMVMIDAITIERKAARSPQTNPACSAPS